MGGSAEPPFVLLDLFCAGSVLADLIESAVIKSSFVRAIGAVGSAAVSHIEGRGFESLIAQIFEKTQKCNLCLQNDQFLRFGAVKTIHPGFVKSPFNTVPSFAMLLEHSLALLPI